MIDLAGVRRLAIEARDRVRGRGERGIDDLHGALPAHAHVLGEIDASHPALADQREDLIALRHPLSDERIVRTLQTQRTAVSGAELLADVVLGAALRADLGRGHELKDTPASRVPRRLPGEQRSAVYL